MNIGQAIKNIRIKKNIKQKDFAPMIGVTQSYLSLIEHGTRDPSLDVLKSLSNAIGIPLPVLFWFGINESDIDKNKIYAYNLLKPSIDGLISELFINETHP